MSLAIQDKKIYFTTRPVDFRMSIDGLSAMIQRELGSFIHDGSYFVFYNTGMDKMKCLFWDRNGFVLYYKRLDKCKFKIKKMKKAIETINVDELNQLLSGLEPINVNTKLIENNS